MPPRKRAAAKAKVEATPIADEVEQELSSPDNVHFDKEDVAAALSRSTDDGPGDLSELPESDWNGYATEGVEQEEAK